MANDMEQFSTYRQTFNTMRTYYQNFVVRLSLPNPLKPGGKSRMKV